MVLDIVNDYIKQPYPLWECELTEALVQNKWEVLRNEGLKNKSDYSTARCVNDYTVSLGIRHPISESDDDEVIYLESPSFSGLQSFYAEHGLVPLLDHEIETTDALLKIQRAMAVISLVRPAHSSIRKLVRAIQVLKQETEEIDTSYSHPKIPFTIFVSTSIDYSNISNLRVAESILHEAMHLKLTLIENIVPLVKPDNNSLYYSPWRDEPRPVGGVLHGLFVFKAISEYYEECYKMEKLPDAKVYLSERGSQIEKEIAQLKHFEASPGLTEAGSSFATSLLP